MEKNFKETVSNIKTKAKDIWDKYKVQIIIGGAAVASTVAVVLLCKEDSTVDVTDLSLDGTGDDSEKLGILIPKNNDDMELGQLICEEIDFASTEAKIMEHFEAVNDLCNEKDIVYNLCGSFGGKLEDNYMGTLIFKDGTCIKNTM